MYEVLGVHCRETCDNGTLLQLKNDVEQKQMEFNCVDDPQSVIAHSIFC